MASSRKRAYTCWRPKADIASCAKSPHRAGMKRLLAAILLPPLLSAGCARHIDAIATLPCPDGAIIAASSSNSGAFSFEAQYYEVRLYPRGGRLDRGELIMSYGEDERKPVFKWTDLRHLRVQLPCGWWSSLTNHYQLPRTSRIIDISYDPPPTSCPMTMTSSTGLPAAPR